MWSLCFGRWELLPGQFNGEPTASANLALDPHTATVRIDDVFDDGQTDADALGFAAQFGAAAVKRLENLLVLSWRNAFAEVLDEQVDG